jgi:predicted phosphoadenosine phosphosulfate sulfurtransferase
MSLVRTFEEGRDVLAAARERFRLIYPRFDAPVVSFSGGKDSTVCLHLALEAAEEAGKLPVKAYFWDEEAIHPETIEYVERVRLRGDVELRWLCLPIMRRNACSRTQPYWYCWDPDVEHLWCRPMPECAEREAPWFKKGMAIPDAGPFIYGREYGTVCDIRGIRADESMRRLMSVLNRMEENWIAGARDGHFYPSSPIFDWMVPDVGPRRACSGGITTELTICSTKRGWGSVTCGYARRSARNRLRVCGFTRAAGRICGTR